MPDQYLPGGYPGYPYIPFQPIYPTPWDVSAPYLPYGGRMAPQYPSYPPVPYVDASYWSMQPYAYQVPQLPVAGAYPQPVPYPYPQAQPMAYDPYMYQQAYDAGIQQAAAASPQAQAYWQGYNARQAQMAQAGQQQPANSSQRQQASQASQFQQASQAAQQQAPQNQYQQKAARTAGTARQASMKPEPTPAGRVPEEALEQRAKMEEAARAASSEAKAQQAGKQNQPEYIQLQSAGRKQADVQEPKPGSQQKPKVQPQYSAASDSAFEAEKAQYDQLQANAQAVSSQFDIPVSQQQFQQQLQRRHESIQRAAAAASGQPISAEAEDGKSTVAEDAKPKETATEDSPYSEGTSKPKTSETQNAQDGKNSQMPSEYSEGKDKPSGVFGKKAKRDADADALDVKSEASAESEPQGKKKKGGKAADTAAGNASDKSSEKPSEKSADKASGKKSGKKDSDSKPNKEDSGKSDKNNSGKSDPAKTVSMKPEDVPNPAAGAMTKASAAGAKPTSGVPGVPEKDTPKGEAPKPSAQPSAKRRSPALGITALVCGIVGVALLAASLFVSILGIPAMVVGAIAVATAIIAIAVNSRNKAVKKGTAIAGMICGIVALAAAMPLQSFAPQLLAPGASNSPEAAASSSSANAGSGSSSGVGSSGTSSSSQPTPAQESVASSSHDDLPIGTAVSYNNGLSIQVDSVNSDLTNSEGSQIVCVTVTYANNGSTTNSFNAFDWKSEDDNGTLRSYTIYLDGENELNSGELSPGGTVTGNLYFEGPVRKIVYEANYWNGDNNASWVVS